MTVDGASNESVPPLGHSKGAMRSTIAPEPGKTALNLLPAPSPAGTCTSKRPALGGWPGFVAASAKGISTGDRAVAGTSNSRRPPATPSAGTLMSTLCPLGATARSVSPGATPGGMVSEHREEVSVAWAMTIVEYGSSGASRLTRSPGPSPSGTVRVTRCPPGI